MRQQALLAEAEPTMGQLGQWFTPRGLADQIVDWAGVYRGQQILEPSAGGGALADAARAVGADVYGVDVDPALCAARGWLCRDFLDLKPGDVDPVSLAILNPPYENDQDLTHVLHAFEFSRHVVALVRLVFLAGMSRRVRLWAKHKPIRIAVLSSRPSFLGEVDGSPRHDFCVVEWTGDTRGPVVEWWA